MKTLQTPGVYVEEIATFPPSVVPASTAIPAFIGYTEKSPSGAAEARRIRSLAEYRNWFGGPFAEPGFTAEVDKVTAGGVDTYPVKTLPTALAKPTYWLYYQLQMFFANGGSDCYIVSVGTYKTSGTAIDLAALKEGLSLLRKEDEPTLILAPDLIGFYLTTPTTANLTNYYNFYQEALLQCADLKDRFALIDLHSSQEDKIKDFRSGIGANNLQYGAAYFPWLETTLGYAFAEAKVSITGTGLPVPTETKLKYDTSDLSALPDILGQNQAPLPPVQKQKPLAFPPRQRFVFSYPRHARRLSGDPAARRRHGGYLRPGR